MLLQVHHKTEYHYSEPVNSSVNELRLTPLTTRWQSCESSFIRVLPANRIKSYEDLNMNIVHHIEIPQMHDRLTIDSRATINTRGNVDFDKLPYGFSHKDLDKCRFLDECHSFLQNSTLVEITPEAWRQTLDIQDDSTDVFQTAYSIMEYIFRNYNYQPGITSVTTHSNAVLRDKAGVCQDFAHAMVAMCRSINIPARYVSGYFYDATRDRSMRGAEASHAWVEVYIDGFGWIGLDPTNNKVIDETYIVLAIGRDYKDVAPVKGSYYGSGRSAMSIRVTVDKL